MVLTNPPFGKKSSYKVIDAEGETETRGHELPARRLLGDDLEQAAQLPPARPVAAEINGRAAIVVPDNVLFEGGAGETVRRQAAAPVRRPHAAAAADGHLLCRWREGQRPVLRPQAAVGDAVDEEAVDLRLPHEPELHAQDARSWSARTSTTSSPATTPATATSAIETERFQPFTYDELMARDKASLDIFWLRDESLEDTDNLPPPEVIAAEIVEDLAGGAGPVQRDRGDAERGQCRRYATGRMPKQDLACRSDAWQTQIDIREHTVPEAHRSKPPWERRWRRA